MVVGTNRNTYIIQQSPAQGKRSLLSVTIVASIIKFIIIISPRPQREQTPYPPALHMEFCDLDGPAAGTQSLWANVSLCPPVSLSLNLPPPSPREVTRLLDTTLVLRKNQMEMVWGAWSVPGVGKTEGRDSGQAIQVVGVSI